MKTIVQTSIKRAWITRKEKDIISAILNIGGEFKIILPLKEEAFSVKGVNGRVYTLPLTNTMKERMKRFHPSHFTQEE